MDRRDFIRNSVLGAAVASGGLMLDCSKSTTPQPGEGGGEAKIAFFPKGRRDELFPPQVPSKQWAEFDAAGFTQPVCGIVYRRKDDVPHGMPLGGVATASLDLDTDGTFGYCNLFNSGVPTRGPMGYGFLGISVGGRTWILSTRPVEGIESAKDIHYWGHYPVADLEYELDAPVGVALRAWTPFIPGDAQLSNTPGAIFEVHIRNVSRQAQKGALAFSFPGPTQAEAQISQTSPRQSFAAVMGSSEAVAQGAIPARRREVHGEQFAGLSVRADTGNGYFIGVIGREKPRCGRGLWTSGYDYLTGIEWRGIRHRLPKAPDDDFSGSIAVDFEVQPDEEKVIRILLAWYSPLWKGEKTNVFERMYTDKYKDAVAVAQDLAAHHENLLKRVLAWQQAIYTEQSIPVWLRESLVNILHLMTKTGYWAQAKPPLKNWVKTDEGLFGMSECPRECPQIECIPCSFYGNVPVVYFFPELARSTLRGYKGYQFPDGAPPWVFGGVTAGAAEGYHATDPCDMATPSPGYQNTLNGPCYVDMFDRYWQTTGDDELLEEFYPSLKKAVIYTINLRPGPEGIISVPAGDRNPTQPHATPGGGLDWFEGNGWFGMTPHVGGVHLAMLRMAERMARQVGDHPFANQCRQWLETGSKLMEKELWAGKYYLSYYEPELNKKSDLIFGYQLDGEWMTSFHGLPGVFQKDRVPVVLNTIKDTCVALNRYGAANFSEPDGKPVAHVGYGTYGYFPPEVYMLAATFIYNGQRDTGLHVLKTCLEGISVKYGYTWSQPNVVSGDTGKRIYGADYYQNMILWSIPAALEAQDLKQAVASGSLVEKVLNAAKQA
ncbi:MAG: GH116 family glycosyl hydrolase [Acidobacteria bacterium]|nr:GH116 family glycosyl hydrolase [Acidobacteriota bacterium]